MQIRTISAIAFLAALSSATTRADEFAIKLKPGPGAEATQANCSACHSLDYILMNAPFPSAQLWDAEVKKMINVFGAAIGPDDAKAITDYLSKNYGS